jgi:WD40 repeat protein
VASGRKQLGLWNWLHDATPKVITGPEGATPFFTADSSDLFAYGNNAIGRWHLSASTNANIPVQLDPLPVSKSRRLYSALLCSNDLVLVGQGGVEVVALTNAAKGHGRLTDGPAGDACVSPDNRFLALSRTSEPQVWIDSMPTMGWQHIITTRTDVMNLAFASRSDELAVATRIGVEFYDTTTWQRTRLLPMPTDRYANLIFAPDGRSLWVVSDSRTSALYDRRTLEVLLPLPGGTLPLAVSPDGRNLAVSVDARRLQVWDLVDLRRQFRDLGVDWESAP